MSARDVLDGVLATGIGLHRLPALLDELEADAFRRGWEARDTETVDWKLPPEPLHVDTPIFDEPPPTLWEQLVNRVRR